MRRRAWLIETRLRRTSVEIVTTLQELDQRIATADALFERDYEAYAAALRSFEFRSSIKLPQSPESDAYREAVMATYRFVSGRDSYLPLVNERSDLDVAAATALPYPYGTRNATTVGDQLMAIGFLIRAAAIKPAARVLEFGPGWGNTTLALAQLGAQVTAVDISREFLEVIANRADQLGVTIECVHCDMLDYASDTRFDTVVFFESFHHCPTPLALLDRLDDLVAPDGSVVFAGEPITDTFAVPWGLRLDGLSAYSIRKYGWMELGFSTRFFTAALRRRGWTIEEHDSWDVAWNRVLIARR